MTPTAELRCTHFSQSRQIHRGLDAQAHRLAHHWRKREVAPLRTESLRVLEKTAALRDLTDRALNDELAQRRTQFQRDAETVHASLAAITEAARRHTGLLAHPAQVMGALALSRGFLAEMHTGEGKTLVIGLAAALAAWTAPTCHVITANDYLAARDSDWLRAFYDACGLGVGCVTGEMAPPQRAAGYAAEITYTTAKEVTADFLRDQLQLGPLAHGQRRMIQSLLQPDRAFPIMLHGLHRAIIDEADHALIDESVTPLIISRKQENAPLVEACRVAHRLASTLQRGTDYTAEEQGHRIELRATGVAKLAQESAALPGMWNAAGRRLELIVQALVAREFFHRDQQYLVADGKIVIIDESTGRLMPDRSWRQGLHQAVEAKEAIGVTAPAETLARLSFQRFFRLYDHVAGITGTAREAAAECWQTYHLPFVRIATHRPCIRARWPDRAFADSAEKWWAVVEEVERLHRLGRPLLIGTRSVAASEHLARLLRERGLKFELLNAVHHREEARIIAGAGEAHRITIATNMAGRGTDIKLTPESAALGGLHVMATERHESGRIDRQLFGRAGRQGDPGSAQAFAALDDDLLQKFTPAWSRRSVAALLHRAAPFSQRTAELLVNRAQSAAERLARQQRQVVVQADSWLDDALAFATGEATIAT